tara:strand:- start:476 stop:850 length:375 start_codon:yes stop_codon:yes gene_type:complete
MTDAITEIKNTYSYEDAKEIVSHGCQSGVCFKHIYYGDTIEFFNKYPDQITRYLVDNLSIEFLKNTLEKNDGDLDCYLNDLTWSFIEQVCFDIIEEYESTTLEELSNDGYNPERSMNESRYAMV